MTPGPGFKREEGGAGDKYYFQSGDIVGLYFQGNSYEANFDGEQLSITRKAEDKIWGQVYGEKFYIINSDF